MHALQALGAHLGSGRPRRRGGAEPRAATGVCSQRSQTDHGQCDGEVTVPDFGFEQWFVLFYTLFAIAAIGGLMWVGREETRQEIVRRKPYRARAKSRRELDR
jgi:hypothetical protein